MAKKRRRGKSSKKTQDFEHIESSLTETEQEAPKAKTEASTAKAKDTSAKAAPVKAAAKKGPSLGSRISSFLKEVRAEMKKVSWPDRERTTNSTLVVIFTLVILALCMTLFTMLFTRVADYFFRIPSATG